MKRFIKYQNIFKKYNIVLKICCLILFCYSITFGEQIKLAKIYQKSYNRKYFLNNILKRYKSSRKSKKFILPIKGRIYRDSFKKGVFIKPFRYQKAVKSSHDGKVIFADFLKYYGNVVIIKHKNGYWTIYAYLNKLYVSKGDKVQKGEYIGSFYKNHPIYFELRKNYKCLNVLNIYKRFFENG